VCIFYTHPYNTRIFYYDLKTAYTYVNVKKEKKIWISWYVISVIPLSGSFLFGGIHQKHFNQVALSFNAAHWANASLNPPGR